MLVPRPRQIVDQVALHSIRHAVNAHCRRFNLGLADRDDLIQEVTLHLLERCDDFNPCIGAWSTFVKSVVRNKLRSVCRATRSGKHSKVQSTLSLQSRKRDKNGRTSELGNLVPEGSSPLQQLQSRRSEQSRSELQADVQIAVAVLPTEQRAVCDSFLEHQGLTAVTESLVISRSTAYRRMDAIRKLFTQLDVHQYI
jgi:RNA polymerase sigma factor (sigma-70 family)